jgi:hypothetical protein
LAHLKGWGELIQIAAPDRSSNAAKEEIEMSDIHVPTIAVQCMLSASESYVETLNLRDIDAQPGLVEFVIHSQLLNAKNPTEQRVKSRTCIELSRLIELQQRIGEFVRAVEHKPVKVQSN